jgi:DNA-binding transcriptional MerR regulator
MQPEDPPARWRIGELSRRVGLTDHVLRAWERRYGLLRPVRTAGGFRLYGEADLRRVRHMQRYLAQGLSAAEAARAALDQDGPPPPPAGDGRPGPALAAARAELTRALDDLDEPAAHAVLDRALSTWTVETVVRDVVMPYLYELGERWREGTVSVAGEHFASNVIRNRLAGLAQGWGRGHGPRAVLACAPGELHDIALLAFGVVLHRHGWRVDFLGADTPIADLIRLAGQELVGSEPPDLVVLAASNPERLAGLGEDLARLAGTVPLALAGAGATAEVAAAVGARHLAGDPVTAARRLTGPAGTA